VCSMCAKRIAVRGSHKSAYAPCSVLASRKQAVGSTEGTAFEADIVAYNSEAARDGIEPPTPAFSGLLADNAKRFRISAGDSCKRSYTRVSLGLIAMI
jgi:hypothetical protein